MALGLSFGACSCVCTLYTVRSFDPDGAERFILDHGPTSLTGLGAQARTRTLLIDGTDLYAKGTPVSGQDDGVLQRWSGIDGAAPVRDWYSDRNGLTTMADAGNRFGHIYVAGRSVAMGDTDLASWDDSGVQQYHEDGGLSIVRLHNLDGVDFYVHRPPSGGFNKILDKYDVDFTLLQEASDRTMDLWSIPDGNGGIITYRGDQTVFDIETARYDSDLTRTATGNASGISHAISNGTLMYSIQGDELWANDAADLTFQWLVTDSGEADCSAVGEDGGIYFNYPPGDAAVRQYDVDGNVQWTTDLGDGLGGLNSVIGLIAYPGGGVVAFGSWTSGGETDWRHVALLDEDGNILWQGFYADFATVPTDCRVDADGNVYLCGVRTNGTGAV